SPETLLEMMELIRDLQALLSDCIRSQGFNIGINIGRCAGAGLPGHLHIHVVPRWSGDTNFMAVLGNVRVIPAALSSLYDDLRRASERLGLPRTGERTP
ncbi:MAG TPA: HIT family hydrolase, partial [Phycisphaerae bacterium]|nr:HIT family hydrolase [Phycisphaerae bacterium]